MRAKIYRFRQWLPARHAVFLILGTLAGCDMMPQPATTQNVIGQISRASINVDEPLNQSVSYLRNQVGAGRRIIFVHGTPGSADGWADYLTMTLAHDVEIISIDRPGFGQSDGQGPVVSLARQAQALEPFLEPIDGKKPILVGHSLGGPIVAKAAAMYPDRIGALLIMAGSLDPGLEKIHWAQPIGEWSWVRSILPSNIANANTELLGLKPELEELQTQLASICMPVAILHGDQDDLVPVENVEFMQKSMTNAKFDVTILEGQNHFLPWNSKSHVDAILQRLLAGLDANQTQNCT